VTIWRADYLTHIDRPTANAYVQAYWTEEECSDYREQFSMHNSCISNSRPAVRRNGSGEEFLEKGMDFWAYRMHPHAVKTCFSNALKGSFESART